MRPTFKTDMVIYQSMADLYVKISFLKVTHLLHSEIRTLLVKDLFGNDHSAFCSVP